MENLIKMFKPSDFYSKGFFLTYFGLGKPNYKNYSITCEEAASIANEKIGEKVKTKELECGMKIDMESGHFKVVPFEHDKDLIFPWKKAKVVYEADPDVLEFEMNCSFNRGWIPSEISPNLDGRRWKVRCEEILQEKKP